MRRALAAVLAAIVTFTASAGLILQAGSRLVSAGGGGVADPYTTSFDATENPISEGGIWTQGEDVGGYWQNMLSASGTAYGAGPATNFEDCIATLQGYFSTTQHYVEITIRKDAGYTPPSTHEVELHVGTTITSNSIFTYEVLIPHSGFWDFVRWNGTPEDFGIGVYTTLQGSNPNGISDGDVVRAEFDSTSGSPIITMYRNDVLVWQVTDTTAGKITSGSPGIAAFSRAGSGLDMQKFAISALEAGSL